MKNFSNTSKHPTGPYIFFFSASEPQTESVGETPVLLFAFRKIARRPPFPYLRQVILLDLITSPDDAVRNQSLDAACDGLDLMKLLAEAESLDAFRRKSENLYHRVRALLFLYTIHRFHIPTRLAAGQEAAPSAAIPFKGY